MNNSVKAFLKSILEKLQGSVAYLFDGEVTLISARNLICNLLLLICLLVVFVVALILAGAIFFAPTLLVIFINQYQFENAYYLQIFLLIANALAYSMAMNVIYDYASDGFKAIEELYKIVVNVFLLSWIFSAIVMMMAFSTGMIFWIIDGKLATDSIKSWVMWSGLIAQTFSLLWIHVEANQRKTAALAKK